MSVLWKQNLIQNANCDNNYCCALMQSTITVADPLGHLQSLFETELLSIQSVRSTVVLEKINQDIQFTITTKDATAMRASLNAICKQLSLYEKAQKIQ